MFNKKTVVIGALAAILLLGVIAPSLPFATAAHNPNHNPGGNAGQGGNNAGPFVDCNTLNPITGGVIDMDVRVKDGSQCTIMTETDSVIINGDVLVGDDSSLEIRVIAWGGPIKDITINGDVKSDGGHRISINGLNLVDQAVNISGNVQIKNSGNGADVSFANIGGSVQFNNNELFYSLNHSFIEGNVNVKGNTNTIDPDADMFNEISDNEVLGNLACSNNDPAPVNDGEINTVHGKAQGQCSSISIEV